jgi:sarcosine/dimethylglycine N-methyltransferase
MNRLRLLLQVLLVPILVVFFAVGIGLLASHSRSRGTPEELKQAIEDHYDLLSPYYKAIWGPYIHHGVWRSDDANDEEATQSLVDELDVRCGLQDGYKILDVGCGYGGAAVYHAKNRSCSVTGITTSQKQVNMAIAFADEAGVADRTSFLKMDAEQISFPEEDGSYDVVWTTEVICHLGDKAAFFEHASRVLKPGGTICLLDHFKQKGLTPEEEAKWIKPIEIGMLHAGLESMETYVTLAKENNFAVVYSEDITQQSGKSWQLVTEWQTVKRILTLVLTDVEFWEKVAKKPQSFIEALGFLKVFWSFRSGIEHGAFRVGIQVYQLNQPDSLASK